MDDPRLDPIEHAAALRGLARLNRLSAIGPLLFGQLRSALSPPSRRWRILDLATGSGDLPVRWARSARSAGLPWEFAGVDFNARAVEAARERARRAQVPVSFWQLDVCHAPLPTDWDVLVCSLFLHHLTVETARDLIARMAAAARHGVLLCDLQRSRLNEVLVATAAHLLSRSSVVHDDALQSVRAAWHRDEFEQLIRDAVDGEFHVRRAPPCRLVAWIPSGPRDSRSPQERASA